MRGRAVGVSPPCEDGEPAKHTGGLRPPLAFNLAELSGGLGDLGTFLPITVALCAVCGLDLAVVLALSGAATAATGFLFRQPIPVQPMKAIAADAVARSLSAGAVCAGGVGMGVAVTLIGLCGWADRLGRAAPRPVVRGLQLGVGAALAWKGAALIAAADRWWVAVPAGLCVLLAPRRPRWPTLPLLVGAGFAAAAWEAAAAGGTAAFDPAPPALPTAEEWRVGLLELVPAQLPLTLLNSVVAVCVLSGDYFPGRGLRPGRVAASVGGLNLFTVPLGGMPVCHGAGGLAAQYHFGARTGGAVILLGGLKLAAAGLLAFALPADTLARFPAPLLGTLLIAAGYRLAAAAGDARGPRAVGTAIFTGAAVLTAGTLVGVAAGAAGWFVTSLTGPVRNCRRADLSDGASPSNRPA